MGVTTQFLGRWLVEQRTKEVWVLGVGLAIRVGGSCSCHV